MHSAYIPEHSDAESLWRTLGHFIASAFAMFGDARALFAAAILRRDQYRAARAWIFRCEEMLRRLIFIDAVKLLAGIGAPRSVPSATRAGQLRVATLFDPDKPETWRVSFALLPRASRFGRVARARGHGPAAARRAYGEFVDVERAKQWERECAVRRRGFFGVPARGAPRHNKGAGAAEACSAGAPASVMATRSLALRLEALDRASVRRETLAKRLARLLLRHRQHARGFTRPTRTYFSRARKPGDHAVAEAAHFAEIAWRGLDSS
jgi:hypothetical protein